ncbi:MAG TPA: hypothetical protein VJ769_01210, partial [Actinomycetes bacterium]|nr:hypothetical protein [Actinomycetes bacterium]
ALHDHVRACPSCSGTMAELQRNAELAAPAIALTAPADPPPAAAEAALARLEQRRARLANARKAPAGSSPEPHPLVDGAPTGRVAAGVDGRARLSTALPRRWGRLAPLGTRARGVAAALIAAVVLTGLVATPGGRAAAASFLSQFRSQRFEVLSLDPTQATQFEEVIGELVDTGVFTGDDFGGNVYGDPRVAADREEASRLAGFAVPMVDPSVLPKGVGRTPERIMVIPARETAITFDRDHALDYLRDNGRPDARLPERFDGTRLVVQLPAVVIQQYAGRDGGPALLVGKAGMLGLDTEGGASLEELREVVLDLPGLPEGTVAQLRAIGDWRNTLPLPVPTDEVSWRATQVEGAEAISFADPSGRLHALLWQRYGYIWGVAGVVGSGEARDVANSLA